MNDKFTEAIDRAKSYVSKLAEEENNLPSNIDLNKIWQLNSRYIVSPIESAIVIIDQSLAHQRILYDGAIKSFNSSSFSSGFNPYTSVCNCSICSSFSVVLSRLAFFG